MNRFYGVLAVLAVTLTPVAMMAALGWTTYAAILAMTKTPWIAVLSGVATAAALEALGIVAGETALHFHARADRRWRLAAAVLLAYVVFGVHSLRATPLMLLPLLAGAVYILVGLRAQAEREMIAAAVQDQDAAAWQQRQWLTEQADHTRIELAKVEARAKSRAESEGNRQKAMPAGMEQMLEQILASRVPVESNPSQHESQHKCGKCGKLFGSVQGMNAHQRWCAGSPAALPVVRVNGHQ